MRFPLVIPPLLLLILNWSSLDSDAVAFHYGSFVAVKSLDHIQYANISSIDGNFATQNTHFRKSSTHDVKPLTLTNNKGSSEDAVSSKFPPYPQDSRGKRQKKDSQEDELAQAEKNVTDLTNEIRNITEKLKETEEEASTLHEQYEEAKAALEKQEKMAAEWKDADKARLEWVSANKAVKKANTSLDEATENLRRANETLDAAEDKLTRVEGEPELLKKLTAEFTLLDAKHTALQSAINNWEDELPVLEQAASAAQSLVTKLDGDASKAGCKGEESERRCGNLLRTLNDAITKRDKTKTAYDTAVADNNEKIEEFAQCEPEWTRLPVEIETLEGNVPNNVKRVNSAKDDRDSAASIQKTRFEKFNTALKTHKEASEKARFAKESFDAIASKIPADVDAAKTALKSAETDFTSANNRKENIDKEVNQLKTTLGEKNAELAQANAKVEALKQSNKEEPKTSAALFIGIGACFGILLIVLIIGGILFVVKRRKSKTKEEPSPPVNPDALKYEKVPALDKSKQDSVSQSSSIQRVTPAKSDTNVAATLSNSNPGTTRSKSDTNIATTQLSSTPATRAQSDTNLKGRHALKVGEKIYERPATQPKFTGSNTPFKPRPMPAPLTTHEKIAVDEIKYILTRRPLINEIAKPTNSSTKPVCARLPSELKWAPNKAIAMQFGDQELDFLPEDILHNDQDKECIDRESEDTQYDRTAPEPDKRTGVDLLNEHVKDKTSVDDALKMATWVFIAVHRRLDPTYLSLVQLAAAVRDVLMKETQLVECGLPVTIFGDIHGQVGDAVRLINTVTFDPANPKSKVLDLNQQHFVFCGDYVDRGNRQVETLMLLFSLKIAFPNNVHILRGNHETRDVNSRYGFLNELKERYKTEDEGTKLYDVFNEVFDHLPLACLIGGEILCVHGGISTHLHSLEDINKIPKPLSSIADCPLAQDLLWADPMNGLSGTKPNEGRGISIHFGEDALDETITRLNIRLIIRGHQIPGNGFAWFGENGRLCTVFVATCASKNKDNFGAVIHINEKVEKQMQVMFKGSLFRNLTAEQSAVQCKTFHGLDHGGNNKKDDDYAEFKEEDQDLSDMDQTRCM